MSAAFVVFVMLALSALACDRAVRRGMASERCAACARRDPSVSNAARRAELIRENHEIRAEVARLRAREASKGWFRRALDRLAGR